MRRLHAVSIKGGITLKYSRSKIRCNAEGTLNGLSVFGICFLIFAVTSLALHGGSPYGSAYAAVSLAVGLIMILDDVKGHQRIGGFVADRLVTVQNEIRKNVIGRHLTRDQQKVDRV